MGFFPSISLHDYDNGELLACCYFAIIVSPQYYPKAKAVTVSQP